VPAWAFKIERHPHRETELVNVILAFLTGLTTGGLSCLAVQGGLLAGSLTSQIEKDLQTAEPKPRKKKAGARGPAAKAGANSAAARGRLVQPILAFLAAKLLAYTLLGFLLGWVGQMFQLSPFARAFLQIAIGIFMLGSALRLLNVHPMFRYFVIEPPAFIRRRIRRTAANSGASLGAPVFLGLLTVLIPCGITQAMMAVALSTASPLQGAALMFAFTLGTSPVFFAVAYFATQLGARLEKHFMRFVAVVLLVLGVVAIDTGLTLAGAPVSITQAVNGIAARPEDDYGLAPQGPELQVYDPFLAGPDAPAVEDAAALGDDVLTITVKNYGYEPRVVQAKAGVPLRLRLVSQNVYSCSLAFVIPSLNAQHYLETTGVTWIDIPPQKAGTRMPFSCSMGMFTGMIVFDS
jgi:uncharacterized protein